MAAVLVISDIMINHHHLTHYGYTLAPQSISSTSVARGLIALLFLETGAPQH